MAALNSGEIKVQSAIEGQESTATVLRNVCEWMEEEREGVSAVVVECLLHRVVNKRLNIIHSELQT